MTITDYSSIAVIGASVRMPEAVPQAMLPQLEKSIAAHTISSKLSGDLKLHFDPQTLKRYSFSWWRIAFGWFDVLQQEVNLIRRYNSNGQTPDAAITPDKTGCAL